MNIQLLSNFANESILSSRYIMNSLSSMDNSHVFGIVHFDTVFII